MFSRRRAASRRAAAGSLQPAGSSRSSAEIGQQDGGAGQRDCGLGSVTCGPRPVAIDEVEEDSVQQATVFCEAERVPLDVAQRGCCEGAASAEGEFALSSGRRRQKKKMRPAEAGVAPEALRAMGDSPALVEVATCEHE